MQKIISKPFECDHHDLERQNQRFDLILRGVHHVGCSYEGRVFLNNPDADEATEKSSEKGYAGSYFIFGHGDCYGAQGHCDAVTERRPYDPTPQPDATPIEIHLDLSEALKRAAHKENDWTVQLTIVPVVKGRAPGVKASPDDVGQIDGPISIVGYA